MPKKITQSSINRRRLTGIVLISLVGVIAFYVLFEFQIQRFLWTLFRPASFYVEVRNGDYEISSIVLEDKVISAQKNSSSVMTPDEIFDIAYTVCIQPAHDCDIRYDGNFHFISVLAIYDTRVIQVKRFIPCQSITTCVSNLVEQH